MADFATETPSESSELNDENLWLEDIHGTEQLDWVRQRNAIIDEKLASAEFSGLQSKILEVLDSKDRIPSITKRGDYYYNYWVDEQNPRGLWRRTTWESFVSESTEWETVLDVDALGAAEGTKWVWHGPDFLHPDDGVSYRRCLVALSPDGGDADTLREFDVVEKKFVDGGFVVPVAKSNASWRDADTLLVGTDFGEGSLTASSYPRSTRILRRGETLDAAEPFFEVPEDHMTGFAMHDSTPGFEREIAVDVLDFFAKETYVRRDDEWVHIDVPSDVNVDGHQQWLLLRPQSDTTIAGAAVVAGGLYVSDFEDFLAGSATMNTIFEPDPSTSLQSWSWTKNFLILNLLRDVSSVVAVADPAMGFAWNELDACPPLHNASAWAVDDETSDDYWLTLSGFLTPSSLLRGSIGGSSDGSGLDGGAGSGEQPTLLRQAPSFFDESKFTVQQHFATSADGTRVPYFQVSPKDLALDGSNPVELSGYGGFEVSRTPGYSGVTGRGWLERGGTYVLANIRGGGEYGPGWHLAALKQNRHRAYEDFAAVAQDLISRGVTSREHLGCSGGSNGGLLVGNMLTQYPELFGAISCGVPLLDMRRYTKLNAGYSWIAEYGDPDKPEEWEYIRTFSPYHLLRSGVDYPATFIWTATSDDRVGPVQARKMAARMEAMGIGPLWYYESVEGGHSGAADNQQRAKLAAAPMQFLWRALSGQDV